MAARTLTGLMVVSALCWGPGSRPADAAPAWSTARLVTVVTVEYSFKPNHLVFRRGIAYRLHLDNSGKEMHEFTAPAFFKAATMRDRRQLANGGVEVVVQPGKSARVFLIAPPKGDYKLTCADHDWDGMVGSIDVN